MATAAVSQVVVQEHHTLVRVEKLLAKRSEALISSVSARTRAPSPCLIGAILIERSDEWATQRARYMTLETIGCMNDNPTFSLPAVAR